MKPGRWMKGLALALMTSLPVALFYHFQVEQQSYQKGRYRQLAWSLRRGDDSGLEGAQASFLRGRFREALAQLAGERTASERELRRSVFRCLMYDIPWPSQILLAHQVGVPGQRRSRLFARVTESGYLGDAGRMRLELMTWDGEKTAPLTLSPQWAVGVKEDGEGDRLWAKVESLETVHLERKDTEESQLWVLGKTRSEKFRLEIYYGIQDWKRWVWLGSVAPLLRKDRVEIAGGPDFKLVDNEWLAIP